MISRWSYESSVYLVYLLDSCEIEYDTGRSCRMQQPLLHDDTKARHERLTGTACTTSVKSGSLSSQKMIKDSFMHVDNPVQCTKSNMVDVLDGLVNALSDDIEQNTLRDLDISIPSLRMRRGDDIEAHFDNWPHHRTFDTVRLPSFSKQSLGFLRGKFFAFIGDSTIRTFTNVFFRLRDPIIQDRPWMKMDPESPNSYLMPDSKNREWIKLVNQSRSHTRRDSNWTMASAAADLSAAQEQVCPNRPWCNGLSSAYTSKTLGPDNVTEVHYLGTMEGRRLHDFEFFVQPIYEGLHEIQPDVLVVNMGLHFLHFLWNESRLDPCLPHADWIFFVVNYETEWLDQVMRHLPDSVKIVLFKTTNRICPDRYLTFFSQFSEAYDRSGPEYPTLVEECRKRIRSYWDTVTSTSTLNTSATYGTEHWPVSYYDTVRLTSTRNSSRATYTPRTGSWTFRNNNTVLTDQQIHEYCAYATFDDIGPIHLNKKLKKWVDQYNKLQETTNDAGPVVQIYNDHSIQQCPYTNIGDGRHFPHLNLARARLLMNQIQCIQSAYNLH